MPRNYMDELQQMYQSGAGNGQYNARVAMPSSGMDTGMRLGSAAGNLAMGRPGADAQSSMAGSRGAYRAGQLRPTGPTRGAPMDGGSAAAAGAGSYQQGRAAQGPQGFDGGERRRPIDKSNPYSESPKTDKSLSAKDRKLKGDVEMGSEDYMSRLRSLYSQGIGDRYGI